MTKPESVFEEDRAPTFGTVHDLARRLATTAVMDNSAWGARFFVLVLQDMTSSRALEAIIAQRNALAHGKQTLPLAEIKKLVTQGVQLESWKQIPETDGELRLVDWQPWVGTPPTGTSQIGLFERWQKNAFRYLVPETGEIFKTPRGSIVGDM